MKTTFILRNLTPGALAEVSAMEARDAHERLSKWAFGDLRHCVSVRYGRGSFADRIEWNRVIKSAALLTMKIEPRRGYRLVTFERQRAA